jgi:hypothetical protein
VYSLQLTCNICIYTSAFFIFFHSQISAQYFIKTVKAVDVKKYALTCFTCLTEITNCVQFFQFSLTILWGLNLKFLHSNFHINLKFNQFLNVYLYNFSHPIFIVQSSLNTLSFPFLCQLGIELDAILPYSYKAMIVSEVVTF